MHRKTITRLAVLGLAVLGIVAFSLGGKTARAGSGATLGWPAAKARIYEQQQQALATAQASPRPKLPEAIPAVAAAPVPTRQAGIVNMRQGPFSPASFLVRNFWQGPVGSDWLLAYAGAKGSSDGSAPGGALRLYKENADSHLSQLGDFLAPTGTGPLTIVAANGNVLQLRADNGSALSFDLQTDQYRQ